MNKKIKKQKTENDEVSMAKVMHNLIMVAGFLAAFKFFGYMGILIFMFAVFYIFK